MFRRCDRPLHDVANELRVWRTRSFSLIFQLNCRGIVPEEVSSPVSSCLIRCRMYHQTADSPWTSISSTRGTNQHRVDAPSVDWSKYPSSSAVYLGSRSLSTQSEVPTPTHSVGRISEYGVGLNQVYRRVGSDLGHSSGTSSLKLYRQTGPPPLGSTLFSVPAVRNTISRPTPDFRA